MEFDPTKQRARARALGLIAVAGLLAAACAPAASTSPSAAAPTEAASPSEGAASPGASADPMADLITAAKAEGALTAIALPDDWCNYGEVIKTFEDKYGIDVTVLDPLAGSGEEIEAIKANVDNPGPQNPDVVDVGFCLRRSRTRTSSSPIRSRPGTPSPNPPRRPTAPGMATTTASCRS